MSKDELIRKLIEVGELLEGIRMDAIEYNECRAKWYMYMGITIIPASVGIIYVEFWNREYPSEWADVFTVGVTSDNYVVAVRRNDIGMASAYDYAKHVLDELDPV